MYALVKTDKGYRVLKDKVIFLTGMQLKFLNDVAQNLIPDLDMILTYFDTLDQFTELVNQELVCVRPQRAPGTGERKLILSGHLYYGIRASVYRAELTDEGVDLLEEVKTADVFRECMTDMDRYMAETLLKRRSL